MDLEYTSEHVYLQKLASRTQAIDFIGARSRNRTGTAQRPTDFKSVASTNFATRADERRSLKTNRADGRQENSPPSPITNSQVLQNRWNMEAEVGIEPASTALQAAA